MSAAPESSLGRDPNRSFDVGSWMATLGRNWWVILGLVLLGAIVGGVLTLASPKEYSATSSVYIGQTTDANGNPMAGLNSNARAATQLLASQAVLNEAAEKAGLEISAEMLRGGIMVETPAATKTGTSAINIVVITVTDTDKQRAAAAANALAEILVERISPAVDEKIAVLEQQLAAGEAALAASVRRSSAAQATLRQLVRQNGGEADSAAAALYVAVVQAAAAEQQALQAAIQKTELVLLTAKQAEQPRILHEAVPPSAPSGPVLAVNVAAGALAGLVIGVLVATFRGRLTRRPRPQVGASG